MPAPEEWCQQRMELTALKVDISSYPYPIPNFSMLQVPDCFLQALKKIGEPWDKAR